MANIELVIKVDERDVDFVRKNFKSTGYSFIPLHIQTEFVSAILNGTPLPKGHGDLVDRKELLKQPIDYANYPSNYVKMARPIIEAEIEDKLALEESEEERDKE